MISKDVYIYNLINQYEKAKGLEYVDLFSEKFYDEFLDWIGQRKEMGKTYANMLNYFGIDYDNSSCAEVEKTSFDYVTSKAKTTIISPFTINNEENSNKQILDAYFVIANKKPYAIIENYPNDIIAKIDNKEINHFLIQNPYDEENIYRWKDLPKNGYDITVGMYGNVLDEDRKKKIEILNSLKHKLTVPVKEEFTCLDHNYYYIISTSNKTRKLTK